MSDQYLRAATQRSRIVDLPDGSHLELRPLTIQDWGTLEEEALKAYKREFLSTYLENLDLIPESKRAAKEAEAWERAEKLTADGIPPKIVESPAVGQDGKVIRNSPPGTEVLLNSGELVTISKLVGDRCYALQKVPYAQWWFSSTFKGRMRAVWLSARRARPGVTEDELAALFMRVGEESLDDAANTVGSLSKSQVGNGQAPAVGQEIASR